MNRLAVERPWALVTGASSGIGEAFARQIAEKGYNVVLVARRAERLALLAEQLRSKFAAETIVVVVDLASPTANAAIIGALDTRQIAIEVFFNNAGYGTNGHFCDLPLPGQMAMIDVNCRSLVALSHAVAGRMRQARKGTIIHTASMGGLSPTPYYAVYGATKAFIVAFSEALAEELRPFGIVVKTLCPGATESEFEARSDFKGTRPPKVALQSAAAVAAELIKSLERPGSLIIPGTPNRFAATALKLLPRSWVLRASARSLRPRPQDQSSPTALF